MNGMDMKLPPCSIESEQAVLGALLMSSDGLDRISWLQPAHFYRADHREIFSRIVALAELDKPVDVVTVYDVLESHGVADRCGGIAYLGELANAVPSAANIVGYAEKVRDSAIERGLIAAADDVVERVCSGGTVAEKLNFAQSRFMALGEQSLGKHPRMMRDALRDHITRMEQRNAGENTGLETGFTLLDAALRGLKPGNLVYLAGRPGSGKTTLAMNIAEHVSMSGSPVLVLSLEMGECEIVDRAVASVGRIALQQVLAGCPEQEDSDRYAYALGQLMDAPLFIDEQGSLTLSEVRAKARTTKRKHGLSLLIIDYLQLMAGDGDSENARITAISAGLKGLAKELAIPIICLSQLNRELEKRTNRRPVMSDLRGSGSIEQDADLTMFVYRDEVYDENSPDTGTAEIIIGKNRQGQTGMVRLAWNGKCTRFDNLAHEWTPRESYQPIRKKGGFKGE